MFAYRVGSATGSVQTSPALSLGGTKVAFVESSTASVFHVLTLATSATSTGIGTVDNPVAPGSNNNALDTALMISGSVSVTRSSPFVDYTNDVAYVGDDSGRLHKFTGVFKGPLAEAGAGTPWPVIVASGVILTGPVFDSVSGNIFVGGSNGNLYCVTSAGAACSTPSISVAGGTTPVLDPPIVDSTNRTVFAAASNSTNSVLMQAPTTLGSAVRTTMGVSGTNLHNGAFDNAYFTSVGTGHMYFCGNLTGSATPAL